MTPSRQREEAVVRLLVRSAFTVALIAIAAVVSSRAGVSQPLQATGLPGAASTGPFVAGSRTVVILLKYADVSEVADVLVAGANVASNDTFMPQQSEIGATSLGNSFGGGSTIGGGGFNAAPEQQQNFGGTFGAQQGLGQRVSDNVAIDRRLNAIILTGPPNVIAALRATVNKLDIPVPSVLLEAQIVELTDTAARNIGLDLSPDGSGIVINGTGSSSGNGGFVSQTGQFPTGQLSFSANLYAQISEGNGRVIARPRILAQSGQPASILTGDALPILTNVLIAGTTGAAAEQVNYVNVGVNLQIQPRVSSDGFVTSHIYSEVSSVTGYVSGNIPQISQRTASTIATVRDGQTIVIGGLRQDNEIRNQSRLPFVSDIPLIGSLFKHVNTTRTHDNLYVIVTPHIVPLRGPTAPPSAGIGTPAGIGAAPAAGPLNVPTRRLTAAQTSSFPAAQTHPIVPSNTPTLALADIHPFAATAARLRRLNQTPPAVRVVGAAPDPARFPAFSYEGRWHHVRHEGTNVATNSMSLVPGSRATLAFLGTEVRLFGVLGPGGGRGLIALDGIPVKANAEFYASLRRPHALIYRSPRLQWGPHWITITVAPPLSTQPKERYVNLQDAEYDAR